MLSQCLCNCTPGSDGHCTRCVCVTVQLIAFNPIYAREHQGETRAEDPTRDVEQEGGALLAKMAVKPFGVSITDGVTPVVKPLVEGGEGEGVGTPEVSLVSKELLVAPHNETGDTVPTLRLKTLMCIFKHAWVDVVQLDLEGGEIELCDARGGLLGAGSPAGARRAGWPGGIPVGQFVIKFSENLIKDGAKRRHRCEKNMDSAGYKVAHRRPDNRMVVFAKMKPKGAKSSAKGRAKRAA